MASRLTNPGGFGVQTLDDQLPSDRSSWLSAGGGIVAKTPVVLTTSGVLSATVGYTSTPSLVRGIAVNAASTSGVPVSVVTQGVVTGVPVSGATAAGAMLKLSTTAYTTGGTAATLVATATPAAGECVAISLAASASGVTTVWVVGGI